MWVYIRFFISLGAIYYRYRYCSLNQGFDGTNSFCLQIMCNVTALKMDFNPQLLLATAITNRGISKIVASHSK